MESVCEAEQFHRLIGAISQITDESSKRQLFDVKVVSLLSSDCYSRDLRLFPATRTRHELTRLSTVVEYLFPGAVDLSTENLDSGVLIKIL